MEFVRTPCTQALAVVIQRRVGGLTSLQLGYQAADPRESRGRGRPRGVGVGGVAWAGRGLERLEGVFAPGARPAGAREGLPPRGGGAGVRSSLTAPAREFQFETYQEGGGGRGCRAAGAEAGPVPAARAPEVRCPGKEAAERRA